MYEELIRTDIVLIKYMDQVKLYDEDFRILDRYRGYKEMTKDLNLPFLEAHFILNTLFKEGELEIFDYRKGNYIVSMLRKNVIDKYLEGGRFYE